MQCHVLQKKASKASFDDKCAVQQCAFNFVPPKVSYSFTILPAPRDDSCELGSQGIWKAFFTTLAFLYVGRKMVCLGRRNVKFD
jgi:hypothetical protein